MKAPSLVFLCVTLVAIPSARSQGGRGAEESAQAAAPAQPQQVAQPATPEPTVVPPLPPAQPPPLHSQGNEAAPEPATDDDQWVYSLGNVKVTIPTPTQQPTRVGQWVYTVQHGWIYMPKGEQYVSQGTDGDPSPYAYAYDFDRGWAWLSAPWVSGYGPYPNYGSLGPSSFIWSSRCYTRRPSPYDLDYNYYGSPMPNTRLRSHGGGRLGQHRDHVGRIPSASYVGRGSTLRGPGGGANSFLGVNGSGLAGFRGGASSLGAPPTLQGGGSGASFLRGGSTLRGSGSGSSSLGRGSVLGGGSGFSAGSHGGVGSHGGGSGRSSSGASVGHRR